MKKESGCLVWLSAVSSELSPTCLVYLVWVSALFLELGRTCLDYHVFNFMAHYLLDLRTSRNIIRKPPNSCSVCIDRLTRATKLDFVAADN